MGRVDQLPNRRGRDDRTSRRGASAVLRRESMLENGSLALTFSNGHRLTILDLFKEYESYDTDHRRLVPTFSAWAF